MGNGHLGTPEQNDKHIWKHYIPATSLAGCKIRMSPKLQILFSHWNFTGFLLKNPITQLPNFTYFPSSLWFFLLQNIVTLIVYGVSDKLFEVALVSECLFPWLTYFLRPIVSYRSVNNIHTSRKQTQTLMTPAFLLKLVNFIFFSTWKKTTLIISSLQMFTLCLPVAWWHLERVNK